MAISTDALLAMLQDKADDAATVSALDEQLVKAERWSDVLALLPTAARGLSEAVQRGRFLIRAASVAAGRLSDSDAAAALYGEVRDLDLPDDSLLSAFQQAFAATQAWADQAAALQAFARVTQVDSQQGRLLFAAGRILEDRLYDHPGAIKAYQLSFRLYPHVPDALHAARAIYAQADEWATVVKLYTYELRIPLDDRSKARVWKELGQVQMNRLSDNASALESFRQALALADDADAHTLAMQLRQFGAHNRDRLRGRYLHEVGPMHTTQQHPHKPESRPRLLHKDRRAPDGPEQRPALARRGEEAESIHRVPHLRIGIGERNDPDVGVGDGAERLRKGRRRGLHERGSAMGRRGEDERVGR
jgi:tetratricopeptide (TPR) repeat protein